MLTRRELLGGIVKVAGGLGLAGLLPAGVGELSTQRGLEDGLVQPGADETIRLRVDTLGARVNGDPCLWDLTGW